MPKILATDLDGTLIPLPDNRANRVDLRTLGRLLNLHQVEIVFVTGRHLASIERAIVREKLPTPNWIIGDIGTSIYRRTNTGTYEQVDAYQKHLAEIAFPVDELRRRFTLQPKLRLQEPDKQGRYKLSYYADADDLPELVREIETMLRDEKIACTFVHSFDPFTHGGLIDFLPEKTSKAYALDWWQHHREIPREELVYAGDSGNDLAAFLAGYRTIVVKNARPPLVRTVFDAHRQNGWHNRFFPSTGLATSGVLEGCRYFGLFPMDDAEQASVLKNGATKCGATPITSSTTYFRVWAPKCETVELVVENDHGPNLSQVTRLTGSSDGYYQAIIEGVGPGDRYAYQLDGGPPRPDPVSAYQPEGVHRSSMVIDHRVFPWQDDAWQGVAKRDLVIYELHVGTFTEKGTFQGVVERLDYLKNLGVTAIELMPVAQSPGRWNWGYDGVNLYAPRDTYGTPDDLKALVDACHAAGIAVFLDVVYNHLGPEGNYLAEFAPYFSEKHHTPWGPAFNFDDPHSGKPVREYIIENALYWLREYHLDGLRLDAIHFILDDSRPPITQELAKAVARFKQESGRTIHLIAETNVYDRDYMSRGPHEETCSYDACWCDDIMHAAYSVTTPEEKCTHRDYLGPTDLAESLEFGYIYANLDNEYTRVTAKDRKSLGTDRSKDYLASLIVALQTHDVIGNHPHGKRIHHLTSKEAQKAIAALILLYPTIPMLFMGEEHATDAKFPFFADFTDQTLRDQVDQGRMREYPHHDWASSPLPCQAETFQAAVLNVNGEADPMFEWYRSLLAIRRQGVEQGWLMPENLEVSIDVAQSLYLLRYREGKNPLLTVAVRITDTRTRLDPVELPLTGTILLDSRHPVLAPSPAVTSILLDAPHAVVQAAADKSI